jgi:hypothetical protein
MTFRVIAGRPVDEDEHSPYHVYRRRSSDWNPDKVVFWVVVLLFLVAVSV